MGLLDRIESWCERCPEQVAFKSACGAITYGELQRKSDALASWIIREYQDDHSPVVVFGHKEPLMAVCLLACVKAGHAYVPVESSQPWERVATILADAEVRLVLSPTDVPAPDEVDGVRIVSAAHQQGLALFDVIDSGSGCRPDPSCRVSTDDNYYILYTSGSTGEPKGVQITLGCLESFLDWSLAEQDFESEHEVFLNQVSFGFDVSNMDFYWALSTGGCVWSVDRDMVANPRRLFAALPDSGATIWVSTPTFVEMCLTEKSFGRSMLPQLRSFMLAGEVLTNACVMQLLERFPGCRVFNMYGPTEATVVVTSILVGPELAASVSPLPLGYVKRDCEVLIMDEDHQLVADGEQGEIIIAGPSVSPGYLGRPELTAQRFFTVHRGGTTLRAYRTGDRGHLKGRLLFFNGRIDSQVKLQGYRIELEDVERNLRAIDWIDNAVVLPTFQKGRCRSLTAFVLCVDRPAGSDFELAMRVRTELKQRLPEYMVPRRIIVKDTFPETPNGKIDRKKLAEEIQ